MAGRWTKEEDQYLRDNYTTKSDTEMHRKLKGRTLSGIKERRRLLGLTSAPHSWTDAEKELMRQNVHLPYRELAKFFPDHTPLQVCSARAHMRAKMKPAKEPESPKLTLDSSYKPSYIQNEIPVELMMAVNIQKMLRGLYNRVNA